MSPFSFFNARGAGDELGVTSERARQLFRTNVIPTIALLNGKIPLTDSHNLLAVKQERERRRRAQRS
jgi:hypothetical protein